MKIIFALLLFLSPAFAQKPVAFGTNWRAQAEHGGFYQALADGTYKKYGLDVTITQGGANINNRLALTHKRLDFYLGGNLIQAFSALEQGLPTRVVSAIFAKDPQALITHEGAVKDFASLKDLPSLYISKLGQVTFYPFLKAKHGFKDDNLKAYSFNPQVFLGDKLSAIQGYMTSEPYLFETISGAKPRVFLLSDYGFNTPSNLIETHVDMDESTRDAFVKASLEGWKTYLTGDNSLGKALILKENPEMGFDKQDYAIATLKSYKIVDIDKMGKLNLEQIKSFYADMVAAGVVKPQLNPLDILGVTP